MISVALDAQGPEVVRPWHEAAKATFPTLVDRENLLGQLYGLKAIPYVLLVNERGELVQGPVSANIEDETFRQKLIRWVSDPSYEAELRQSSRRSQARNAFSPEEREAQLRFQLGQTLLERGKKEEALSEWRKALSLDPGNWIIHKQIWAVEHPERFYQGPVDYQWQKQQLEAEKER